MPPEWGPCVFSTKGRDWFRLQGLSHRSPNTAWKTMSQAEGRKMGVPGFSEKGMLHTKASYWVWPKGCHLLTQS